MDWSTLFFYPLAALLGAILSWLYFSYGQKETIENLKKEALTAREVVKEISTEHKTALTDHSAKINMRDAEVALLKKKLSTIKGNSYAKTSTNKEELSPDKKLVKQNKILEVEIETLVAALDKKSKALVKLQNNKPNTPTKSGAIHGGPNKGPTQKLDTTKGNEIIELESQLSKAESKINKLNKKLKERNNANAITQVIETLNIKKIKKLLSKGKLTSKKIAKKTTTKKGKA